MVSRKLVAQDASTRVKALIIALSLLLCSQAVSGCGPQVVVHDDLRFDIRSVNVPWACYGCPHGNVERIGLNDYCIRSSGFTYAHANMEHENYCWAAAVHMVLKYHNGHAPSQDTIVREMKSIISDNAVDSGNAADIMTALLGPGRYVNIENGNGNWLLTDVAFGYPVIVALRNPGSEIGHVYVLFGMDVSFWQGYVVYDTVLLYDPTPGMGSVRMDAAKFRKRLDFAIHMVQSRPLF